MRAMETRNKAKDAKLAEASVLFYSNGNYEELGGYSRMRKQGSGGVPQKIARTNTSRLSDKPLCNKEYDLFS